MQTPLDRARQTLRAHRLGRLVAAHADGVETRAEDAHFVIDGSTGWLVFSVTRVLLELGEHTLFVPDELAPGDDETLEMIIEMGERPTVPEVHRDRHLAYHGHIRGGIWVYATVLSARFGEELFSGDELMQPNALASCEPKLCRACNQQSEALLNACRRRWGVGATPSATVVGVDDCGLYVRVFRGIRRLEFAEPAATEEQAMRQIRELLESGERL